ncbi:ribosomal protein S18-alanine N-acetyltransferase [Alienimonas sp. DA493]|uniref:ribosomal protein S18-alanine N-acetyltransferase n=1 Tax=Alienimonas sp. DA493 TaxID=3373605 RepID=UPI0037552BBE
MDAERTFVLAFVAACGIAVVCLAAGAVGLTLGGLAVNASQIKTAVEIRWLIRRDMPAILNIEWASFPFAWSEEDFIGCLRERDCIGMVAEAGGEVVGYMIYQLQKARLRVLNFAVSPFHRREGIGRQMVARMVDKLSQQRRTQIVLEVRETNLPAQLFFRSMGFQHYRTVRDRYDDTPEDAYAMAYWLPLRSRGDDQTADVLAEIDRDEDRFDLDDLDDTTSADATAEMLRRLREANDELTRINAELRTEIARLRGER